MNVKFLFIMILIDKYIERVYRSLDSGSEVLYVEDLHDFMYDFLFEFNSMNFSKIKDFGNSLVSHSLATRYYGDCSKFCELYNKKIKKISL